MSEPRLFDDVIEDRNLGDVAEALGERVHSLSISIHEILFMDEEEGETFDRQGMIQESIEQFAADMDRDLPGLMSGEIVKNFETDRGKDSPTVEDVAAYITQAVRTGGDMKLFESLNDEERAALTKIWARAEQAEPAEAEVALLKTAGEELQKKLDAAPKDDDDGDDDDGSNAILVKLDPDVRKSIESVVKVANDRTEAAEARVETIEKTLDTIKKDKRRGELVVIAKTLTNLNQSEEALTEVLVAADESGTLETVQAGLEGASEAASAVFTELGSDGGGAQDGTSEAALNGIAQGIHKANPAITFEKAYTQACETNPELQAAAIAEAN